MKFWKFSRKTGVLWTTPGNSVGGAPAGSTTAQQSDE